MAISGFNSTIAGLTATSTFYDWYIKENEDIIAKLNLAKVADVTGGDGILASLNATSGLVTLSFGGTSGTITKGLTFTGAVSFLGETTLPTNSYRITGITSGTTGFTFGTVVRIVSTGYTTAQANSQSSAEVLGVISAKNTNYSVVTTAGLIRGDFSEVAGGTLSPGCVYFLSPADKGKITTSEPSTIGQVSKPVIIGVGETAGIVVQYRGNYLNAIGTCGESGTNRIAAVISTSPTDPRSYGFSAGVFLSYAPDVISGNTFFRGHLSNTGRTAIDGWFLSGSSNYINLLNYSSGSGFLNIPPEEDFIVGMVESIVSSGSNLIYTIVARGTSSVIPRSLKNGTAKGSWLISGTTYAVVAAGITQLTEQPIVKNSPNTSFYQVGFAFNDNPTFWYVNPRPLSLTSLTTRSLFSAGGSESTLEGSDNFTFNGDFEIWQRNTARTENTSTGSFYFADNWVRRQVGMTGVQTLERKQFSQTDTSVEGNPKYYIDFKALSNISPDPAPSSSAEYSVGHIIENVNTLNNSNITISFHAKSNSSDLVYRTVNVYFARYGNGSRISKEVIETITLTTTWEKYSVNYTVPALTGGPYTDDYVEIGIDLIPQINTAYTNNLITSTDTKVSLASLAVYSGTYTNPTPKFDSYNRKLEKAQKFLFSTYTNSQNVESSTMNGTTPTLNSFIFTYLPTTPYSILKFPQTMRSVPTVTIYSPFSGVSNEMYNISASRDMKNTSSTYGFDNKLRQPLLGLPTTSSVQDNSSVQIIIEQGAVPYDAIGCHVVADASYPI